MRKQKCSLNLYSDFLIANQNRYSGAELSRVAPSQDMSHDAVSRWLAQSDFTSSGLWNQVKGLVQTGIGYLIGDDTVLEKKHSRQNELARWHYSGSEHDIVKGIPLVNLIWTKGQEFIPVDYRLYQKQNDNKTKNELFKDMLKRAKQRGFKPFYVLMDSWYSSIENLKFMTRDLQRNFICNLKSNRRVSPCQGAYCSIADLPLTEKQVRKVWLRQYGYVLVCKIVDKDGDSTYLATNDLALTDYNKFIKHWSYRWNIEEFHRGIKQATGIEKCYSTKAESQKTHIFSAFTAFIKLEINRLKEHISWYEQKAMIARISTIQYLRMANA